MGDLKRITHFKLLTSVPVFASTSAGRKLDNFESTQQYDDDGQRCHILHQKQKDADDGAVGEDAFVGEGCPYLLFTPDPARKETEEEPSQRQQQVGGQEVVEVEHGHAEQLESGQAAVGQRRRGSDQGQQNDGQGGGLEAGKRETLVQVGDRNLHDGEHGAGCRYGAQDKK